MVYKEIKRRVLKNINKTQENAEFLRGLADDIQDAIVDIYGSSKSPRNIYATYINETVNISEDFEDTSYIDGLSFSGDFVLDSGALTLATDESGTITITGLEDINTVTLYTQKSGALLPSTNDPTGTVKVLAGDGTELFSEDITISELTETITVSPGVERSDIILQINLSTSDGWEYAAFNQIDINIDYLKIDMPSDFLFPLEVKFSTNNFDYLTLEMPYEAYRRWRLNIDYPTITELINSNDPYIAQIFSTEENIRYDGAIGYAFNITQEKVQLVWKPKVAAVLEITYVPIINPTIEDASTIDINRAFIDLLVSDVTIRQLNPKLLTAKSEVELVGIRTLLSRMEEKKAEKMKEFVEYGKSKANTETVKPQNFLNDYNMLVRYSEQ